jgi:hypothetical protein
VTDQTTAFRATPQHRAKALTALVLAVTAGALLALLLQPGRGQAATATTKASASLALTGTALAKVGVTASVRSGATKKKSTVTLPVSATVVSSGAALGLKGTVVLRAKKRSATFTKMRLIVSAKRKVTVTASVGGRNVTFLTGTAAAKGFAIDKTYGTAAFAATNVTLSKAAGTAVQKALKLKKRPTGTLGKLTLVAPPAPDPTTTPTTTTPTTTTPTTTTPTTTTPDTPAPFVEPESTLARPATAVDIKSARVTWHPRDSWTNYVNSGTGSSDGVFPTDGATAGVKNLACGPNLVVREYSFTLNKGWFDPASGQTMIQTNGKVQYKWAAHTIDLAFRNPEVRLGPVSEVTFRGGDSRGKFVDLTRDAAPLPSQCAADAGPTGINSTTGTTARTYERVPATFAEGAESVFAGAPGGVVASAYQPGSEWGWFTVSFSTVS